MMDMSRRREFFDIILVGSVVGINGFGFCLRKENPRPHVEYSQTRTLQLKSYAPICALAGAVSLDPNMSYIQST